MKITIESYGKTHTAEFDHDDVPLGVLINSLYALLIGVTFNEHTIVEGFREFLEEKDFYKKEAI
jgi:hypothetical protein